MQKDVKDIRREFAKLTGIVEKLAFEIVRVSDREQHERKMIALRLENEMLKFERRLPQPKDSE